MQDGQSGATEVAEPTAPLAPTSVAPPPDRRHRQLAGVARGSAANLVGAFVLALCTFALTVAVTRGLSPQAAGVFFSATSLFVLAINVGQLGTGTGMVYFLSRCRADGWRTGAGPYVRAALTPVLVSAVVMGVGMFAFAPQIAALTAPGHEDVTVGYLRVLAVFVPLAGVENVLLAATRGVGSMRANVVVEQLGRPVAQLALVLLAVLLVDGRLLPLAWSFAYLPAAAMAILWWRKVARRLPAAEQAPTSVRGEFWRFSAPRAAASVGQVAMQRLDIVLVGALAGVGQAAVYAAATRFLVIGQLGNRAISLATQPRLGVALAQQDRSSANNLYQVATGWLMLLAWPVYLTLIAFGGLLLEIFGHRYTTGTAVVVLLSGSMLLATGCGMVDMVLNMAGRTSWNLANIVLALTVNLGLDLWLIPSHGILGAAIGWASAIAVSNLVALTQVAAVLRLHPVGATSLRAAALTATCFGVVPWLVRSAVGLSWGSASASCAISLVLFAAGVWRWRGPLEIAVLRQVVGRRGSRRAAEPHPS